MSKKRPCRSNRIKHPKENAALRKSAAFCVITGSPCKGGSKRIPDSVTFIGNNAFNGCGNLTITVSEGSYAAGYCEKNGLAYIYPNGSLDWLND